MIHIKRIFDEDRCEAILSATLVVRLKEDPEASWAEWNRGKGLSQKGLADLATCSAATLLGLYFMWASSLAEKNRIWICDFFVTEIMALVVAAVAVAVAAAAV